MSLMRSSPLRHRLSLRAMMSHVAFAIGSLVILDLGDREATESRCGTPVLLAIVIVFNLGMLYAYAWYVASGIRKRHNSGD